MILLPQLLRSYVVHKCYPMHDLVLYLVSRMDAYAKKPKTNPLEDSDISPEHCCFRCNIALNFRSTMPWLIKDQPKMEDNLLFVHVPRCGGTSLMKSHDVPRKCLKGRSLWGKLGMKVFFHRYALLESANFPIFTGGNALSTLLFAGAVALKYSTNSRQLDVLSNYLMATALAFLIGLSFVFTAPTIGRLTFIRRIYLIFVHYILCRFMESIEWCTGTNKKGYMNHLTAPKLIAYGYITPDQLRRATSMALVRNPYSRMVSIYMYNRFGRLESFTHFVKSWYSMMTQYRESGETEEWYTPCHAIPQFEYTHRGSKQLVQFIIKQEELKFLKMKKEQPHRCSSVSNLPDVVRDALLGMPHSNQRATEKKWYDYYTQETLNLVYNLYHADFEVFEYPVELSQRPDLRPPTRVALRDDMTTKLDNATESTGEIQETSHSRSLESSKESSRRPSLQGCSSWSDDDMPKQPDV